MQFNNNILGEGNAAEIITQHIYQMNKKNILTS